MTAEREKWADKVPATEWVEIIEPRTKEKMYANLTTGDCVWDPPEGVYIKRTSAAQWWELFDTNTGRFYYYNVASQKTVWHRPDHCDIIPLAKLQTLKQNNDGGGGGGAGGAQRRHIKTAGIRTDGAKEQPTARSSSSSSQSRPPAGAHEPKRNSDLLASPQGRHSLQYSSFRLPATTTSGEENSYNKYCKHGSVSRNNQKYLDSGKSSDSSLSSAHGYRKMQEGGSLRLVQQGSGGRKQGENFRLLQESASSHNIPHIALPSEKPSTRELQEDDGQPPPHSISTPQLKKKLGSSDRHKTREKQHSFDVVASPSVSLTRSGSFMSPVGGSSPSGRPQYQLARKNSLEGGSDDSMHEKYFKSVENTPLSRRRAKSGARQRSSDSSAPASPVSPPAVVAAAAATKNVQRPSQLVIDTPHNYKSSSQRLSASENNSRSKTSPSAASASSSTALSIQQINQLMKSGSAGRHSSQAAAAAAVPEPNRNSLGKLSKPNLDRHNKEILQATLERKSGKKGTAVARKHGGTLNTYVSDVEYDNGNVSPLYSNWDQEMQEHLLPLQHYILEQAKLSGCYKLGDDQLDSDSYHSESQSEHSLSGHEPDNEDSDRSDDERGDYLTHYAPYENYGAYKGGVSYYNFELNYDRGMADREDISEQVTAKLESMHDQLYSPVKNHPSKMSAFAAVPQKSTLPMPAAPTPAERRISPTATTTTITVPDGGPKPRPKPPRQQLIPVMPPQPPVEHPPPPAARQAKATLLQRFQADLSMPTPPPDGKIAEMALMKECDIEKFAQDNLNLHSKGIFRKKSSIRDMLSWTADAISRPMLSLPLARDKAGKKMATELFKLVQIYMGDRKARAGMSLNSVAMDIISMAVGQPQLRDELYVQLCRQTTENPMRESLIRGWELLAICLAFIPPSPTFQPALLGYMNRHRDPTFATAFPEVSKWPTHVQVSHYATIACRRLERIGSAGKKQAKKPTPDDIDHAREQIFRDSMFGNTLDEVMELQKERFPDRQLPWIQTTLSEQVLILNGMQTEGIFRVPADMDEVNYLKSRLDRWEFPENKGTMDAHTPASLLKLWYRELYDPLIPDDLYDECVQTEDPKEAAAIVERLPRINILVLTYLIHFLQQFAQPDVVTVTKMDASNLAMVFAPNILRCASQDPKVILENARKEMAFMRTLIQHMDTTNVKNLK